MQSSQQNESDTARLEPLAPSAARLDRLQVVQAFIDDNLDREMLRPARTAGALGISVRQLHMLFKPTGTTFARYVLIRRLERARLLLVERPDAHLADIAGTCGIRSATVFYRGFARSSA